MSRWLGSLIILAFAFASHAAKWPFDQRQILLVQNEGSDFPDELSTAQILDAFVQRGRIRFATHKEGASPVTPLKVPRDFVWSSSPSVRQLGLKYKADGIIVLRKKGVRVELEWYSVNDGEPVFFEAQSLPDPSKEQEAIRKDRIQKWVKEIWARIPGQGYVIRRDLDSVFIEGSKEEGLRVGDRIDLARVIRITKHPVLKTLMTVETSQSGVAVITDIADPLTRAKIEYESPADPIEAGDRYRVRPPVAMPVQNVAPIGMAPAIPGTAVAPPVNAEPRVADLTVLGMVGSYSHQDKLSANSTFKMNGTAPGFEIQAKGYLTREWLADAHFGMHFFKFTDVPNEYAAGGSINSGFTTWRVNGGYRIFFMEDMNPGGELTAALGYSKYNLKMKRNSADAAPQAKAFSGFEVALRLQVPVVYRFAATFNLYKTLGAGLSETPKTSGATSSNSAWQFQIGGKYLLTEIQEVSAGLRYTSLSSDFEGQGSRVTASDVTSIKSTQFIGGYTHKF